MTAFDANLNVSNVTIGKRDDQADKLMISLEVAQLVPVDQNRAAMIPIGTFRFLMNGTQAVQFGEDLKREGEKLPPESKLAIASDLSQVEESAQGLSKLTKGEGI